MTPLKKLLLLLTLGSLVLPMHAENWPHWRGPQFNGASTEKNLPAEFSKTQNVKWAASMPGSSAATPIIWDDHVFVSTTDERTRTLHALALDRKTGKVLWDQEVAVGYGLSDNSNFASPSPVTDGQLVLFLYGNGE